MTTTRHLPRRPPSWLATVLLLALVSLLLVVWLREDAAPAATAWERQGAVTPSSQRQLQTIANLLSQTLSDRQNLLQAYAHTVQPEIFTDTLALHSWASSHGVMLARLYDQAWIVEHAALTAYVHAASSSADTGPPYEPRAQGLQPLPASSADSVRSSAAPAPPHALRLHRITGVERAVLSPALAIQLARRLQSSAAVPQAELLPLDHHGTLAVLTTSPVLDSQGRETALLAGLSTLPPHWLGEAQAESLSAAPPPHRQPDTEGLFLALRNGQILAGNAPAKAPEVTGGAAGLASWLVHAPSPPEAQQPQAWQPMQQQIGPWLLALLEVPGSPWLLGSMQAVSRPSLGQRVADWAGQAHPPALALLLATGLLGLAALAVGAIWGLQAVWPGDSPPRRPTAAWTAAWPAAALANSLRPGSNATAWTSRLVGAVRALLRANPLAPRPAPGQRQPPHLLGLLRQTGTCALLVNRHGQVQQVSQGVLEFLQLTRQDIEGTLLQHFLAHRPEGERLRVLMDHALRHRGMFTCALAVTDGLQRRQPVWMQAFVLEQQRRTLIVFEPASCRFARPVGIPAARIELDELSHLPSLECWTGLVHQALLNHQQGTRAPSANTAADDRKGLGSEDRQDCGTAAGASAASPPGHIFFLDIDGFSVLLSSGGQALGNEALRYVANTITDLLAYHAEGIALPTRVSRDSFAFVCFGTSDASARKLAHALREAVASLQASYLGTPMALSISVGIAPLPQQAEAEALQRQFHAADLACYEATARGGGTILSTADSTT